MNVVATCEIVKQYDSHSFGHGFTVAERARQLAKDGANNAAVTASVENAI